MDPSQAFAPLLVACDDAATLEAALDFVDHCDDLPSDVADPDQAQDFDVTLSNLSEFLGNIDTPAIKSPQAIVHHDIVLSEPSRRRRTTPKQEIAQLRAEERDLACRLEILRLQAYDHKQRDVSGKNSKVLPFWKKIASRQYQTQLNSERENRRLRSLVKMHVGRAQRLTLAWKKQMTVEGYKRENAANSQLSDEFATSDTPAVVEQLKMDADEVYATLDAFCAGTRQQQRSRVPFLEHSEAYSLPFTRQTVERAMWHRLASRFHGNQKQLTATDDTITCCALRSLRLPPMDLVLRVRYVARKFREADRTVIISRTFVQPLHLMVPAQVGFRETQVSIVTSSQTASAHVDTHTCVTGDGPDGGTGDGMRAWMNSPEAAAVRGVWMNAFQLRKNAIEDHLFEESRAQLHFEATAISCFGIHLIGILTAERLIECLRAWGSCQNRLNFFLTSHDNEYGLRDARPSRYLKSSGGQQQRKKAPSAKVEIERLRQESKFLEDELERLLHQRSSQKKGVLSQGKRRPQAKYLGGKGYCAIAPHQPTKQFGWKGIAKRQWKELLKAQSHNQELRSSLEVEFVVRSELGVFLSHYSHPKVDTARRSLAPMMNEEDISKELVIRAENALLELGGVLVGRPFADLSGYYFDSSMEKRDNSEVFVVCAKMTLPFKVNVCVASIWKVLSSDVIKHSCYYHRVVKKSNTTVAYAFGT